MKNKTKGQELGEQYTGVMIADALLEKISKKLKEVVYGFE